MFFKKKVPNDKFNNMLIAATSEGIRKTGRLPTEKELTALVEQLADKANCKLTEDQYVMIRLYGSSYDMGVPEEALSLFKQHIREFPGSTVAYYKIVDLFGRNGMFLPV